MKFFVLAFVALTLLAAEPVSVPDYSLLGEVLSKHVRDGGLVDYAGIRDNPSTLDRFTEQIAAVSPDSHPEIFRSREAKLAYWINAYNAYVLQAFSKDYPAKRERLKGLIGRALFFYRTKHVFGGVKRSLDDIETNSMRKGLKEPRIHFAIVCASASCPWLAKEAYQPEKLDSQLENEGIRYFSLSRNFRFDDKRNEVWLPEIFDWFREDWGGDAGVLRFVARYRPAESTKLTRPGVRIRYFKYDWSPNDVAPKAKP